MEGTELAGRTYTTTSLAVAAFILAGGEKLRGVSRNDSGRVCFVLGPQSKGLADRYEADEAVSAKSYYKHLTALRAMVRDL